MKHCREDWSEKLGSSKKVKVSSGDYNAWDRLIEELIVTYHDHVVHEIFLHLNPATIEIIGTLGPPHWCRILENRAWQRRYLAMANNRLTILKMHGRRIHALQAKHESIKNFESSTEYDEAGVLFRMACLVYAETWEKQRTSCSAEYQEFKIMPDICNFVSCDVGHEASFIEPVPSPELLMQPSYWEARLCRTNDDYIAVLMYREDEYREEDEEEENETNPHLLSLFIYDRWTFQLINAMSFRSNRTPIACEVLLPGNDSNSSGVVITDQNVSLVTSYNFILYWNFKLGSQQCLTYRATGNDADLGFAAFRVSNNVIVRTYKEDASSSEIVDVYKENIDTGVLELSRAGLELGFSTLYQFVLDCNTNHDWFGVDGVRNGVGESVFQIRSTDDLRLLHQVTTPQAANFGEYLGMYVSCVPTDRITFANCLVFGVPNESRTIQVRSPVDHFQKLLHEFEYDNDSYNVFPIGVRGNHLYAENFNSSNPSVLFWKLPENFFESCRRRLVDDSSPLDRTPLSRVEHLSVCDFIQFHFDGYGVSQVYTDVIKGDGVKFRLYNLVKGQLTN